MSGMAQAAKLSPRNGARLSFGPPADSRTKLLEEQNAGSLSIASSVALLYGNRLILQLPKQRGKGKAVARTLRTGNVAVPNNVLQWNSVPRSQLATEANQRGNLRLARSNQALTPTRIVAAAEITYNGNPQIRVVSSGVGPLATLRPTRLYPPIRQD